ncbi:MAG: glycosyltransferase [Kiritimatiellae bacterium]|nr:glycosyltransferase [Kiritimatiellia bacterium]
MKILFISDRRDGGILRHVRCLRQCLPKDVDTFEIGLGGDEEFAGSSGHDIREFWQLRRIIKNFKPDIVHFHIPVLLMAVYVRFFTRLPIIRSWHTPTAGKEGLKDKIMRWVLGRGCYYLPVSGKTLEGLRQWCPTIKGEVFYNPIRINRQSSGGDLKSNWADWKICRSKGLV